jgi:hypothetical protein
LLVMNSFLSKDYLVGETLSRNWWNKIQKHLVFNAGCG